MDLYRLIFYIPCLAAILNAIQWSNFHSKSNIAAIICTIAALISLIFCHNGGNYIFTIFDNFRWTSASKSASSSFDHHYYQVIIIIIIIFIIVIVIVSISIVVIFIVVFIQLKCSFSANIPLLVIALFQCIGVAYFYGLQRSIMITMMIMRHNLTTKKTMTKKGQFRKYPQRATLTEWKFYNISDNWEQKSQHS